MIWQIAKKELYDNWQSHKITLAFGLCLILMTISVWLGLKDYSARLASYDLTRSGDTLEGRLIFTYLYFDNEGKIRGKTTNVQTGKTAGIHRRPAELSILARGLEDWMNRPVQFQNLQWWGKQAGVYTGKRQERNSVFLLFSAPDFLFITKMVVSLLTILFAFDTIAGERERGTLQLIFSNAVSRSQVLLGKFLGGYLSLALPFLAAALIALLILALSPSVALGGEGWLRVLCLLLVSMVYIAVFFLVGLSVSALTSQAATAVLTLLAIWAVVALVVPSLGWLAAEQLVKVPSRQQIDAEKLRIAREIEDEAEKKGIGVSSATAGYGLVHGGDTPDKIKAAFEEIEERYTPLKRKQMALARHLTRISPVGAFSHVGTGLTQTGIADEAHYQSQLKQYASQIDIHGRSSFSDDEEGARFASLWKELWTPEYTQKMSHDPIAYREAFKKIQAHMARTKRNQLASVLAFGFEKLELLETLHAIRLSLFLLVLWLGLGFAFAMLVMTKCELRP